MKIGISFNPYGRTYGRYDERKFLKIKQHGYDAVDYNIANTDSELYSVNEDELRRIVNAEKRAAQSAGIQISQIHGPWQWPPQDSSQQQREERLDKMKKSVIITSLLGCDNLVIHPIMPYGIEDLKFGKQQETWDLNVEFFKSLIDFAKQYSITICLENMPMRYFSIATPEKILELVKEINDDHFKICLDTGHVSVFPELSIGNEIRKLGDYIRVLHIHDNMGDNDSHLYPTKGIIDWYDFVNALDEIGYEGVLSLETSPSGNLEDDVFEKESIDLCKMFKELILANQKKDI
jgi:sugar phosphate isomerase/epimerase